jgi:hypothetical protein
VSLAITDLIWDTHSLHRESTVRVLEAPDLVTHAGDASLASASPVRSKIQLLPTAMRTAATR